MNIEDYYQNRISLLNLAQSILSADLYKSNSYASAPSVDEVIAAAKTLSEFVYSK